MQALLHNTTMRLQDSGILRKLKNDALNPPWAIPDPIVRIDQPLSIWQVSTAMFTLVSGISLGTVIFIVELCTKKRLKRNLSTSRNKKIESRIGVQKLAQESIEAWRSDVNVKDQEY